MLREGSGGPHHNISVLKCKLQVTEPFSLKEATWRGQGGQQVQVVLGEVSS